MKIKGRREFALLNIPKDIKFEMDELMCDLQMKISYGKFIKYLINEKKTTLLFNKIKTFKR